MSERSDALAARLLNCYAAAVHDVLRGMGVPCCVLPPSIRPLEPSKKLAGEIYTVSGHIDMTRDPHDTLVQFVHALYPVFKLTAALWQLFRNFNRATPDVTS